MRFLYHIEHGSQLFEEDGVDHAGSGWFDHPEKAGLVPLVDPNGPTKWAKPSSPPRQSQPPAASGPTAEPLWVQVSPDWADMHWTQQVKLANEIIANLHGAEVETVSTKPAAVGVIEAELKRRKA